MRQVTVGRSAVSVAKVCLWMIFSPCSVTSSEVAEEDSVVSADSAAEEVRSSDGIAEVTCA